MNFFKSSFKTETSNNPEDYPKIFFRWDREGKEYGPLWFNDMISRKWSGPPIEGRFENESIWREYSYFEEILNNLKISQEQISKMTKIGITNIDPNMSFINSIKTIEIKKEEFRKKREEEREEKAQLPATNQTIKKLNSLGIKYRENITRHEANELIVYHKDKEYLSEIFNFLKKNNLDFIEQLSLDSVLKGSVENLPTFDQFDELFSTMQSLLNFDIDYNYPNTINKDEMEKLINRLNNAEFESEDIEEQLKDREIMIGSNEFKVVGKLPRNQLIKIRTHIINKFLADEWNSDRDLIKVIEIYLPEVNLKEIEY